MKKLIFMLSIILAFSNVSVFAEDEVAVSLKTSGTFNVTVNCSQAVGAYAFIYTYKEDANGYKSDFSVIKKDVPFGGSTTFTVTPPKSGYKEKLAVFNRVTLQPICKAYEYPYIINISTEPLGFVLKSVGSVTKGTKEYVMNEYDIQSFTLYDPEELSAVSLLSLAR